MGKILATVGSKKSSLVFQLAEFKNIKTLDIRKHFYDDDKDEMIPTKKGISLGEKTFEIVKNVLAEHDEEIKDWPDKKGKTEKTISNDISNQQIAAINIRNLVREYEYKEVPMKSPLFFNVEADGGVDKIYLNTNHRFYKTLCELRNEISVELSALLMKIVGSIILAFTRSQRLFDNSSDISPEHYFDTLLFNWGTIMQNYLDKE